MNNFAILELIFFFNFYLKWLKCLLQYQKLFKYLRLLYYFDEIYHGLLILLIDLFTHKKYGFFLSVSS